MAKKAKDANRSRRLLSLAAVLDGKSRAEAATIGGMDRQTLRDCVHRFNTGGPDGLKDNWTGGVAPRLSADQRAELAQIVEAGPDREKDGVVRWRRVDLQRVIAERFGVAYCERYVGTLLKKLDASINRAGSACLDSSPRKLSGFLPGYIERGALRFWLAASRGRSPTRAASQNRAARIMRPSPSFVRRNKPRRACARQGSSVGGPDCRSPDIWRSMRAPRTRYRRRVDRLPRI